MQIIENMKINRQILILLILCITCASSFAQKKEKKISFKNARSVDAIEAIDSMRIIVDSLHKVLSNRDSTISANMKLIDSIYRKNESDSLRMVAAAKSQKDSLYGIIREKDKEIIVLKSNIGFVDTCMVKLANRWLYEPFDKADVDEAISYFDRIYSSRLKEDMSIVQELLYSYERSYREFQSILRQAQSDIDRESPFVCEEYKNKYIRMIESMPYYLKYYNADWNIRYLNGQIKDALERLNNHSDTNPADFSSLIDTGSDI